MSKLVSPLSCHSLHRFRNPKREYTLINNHSFFQLVNYIIYLSTFTKYAFRADLQQFKKKIARIEKKLPKYFNQFGCGNSNKYFHNRGYIFIWNYIIFYYTCDKYYNYLQFKHTLKKKKLS